MDRGLESEGLIERLVPNDEPAEVAWQAKPREAKARVNCLALETVIGALEAKGGRVN